MLLSKGRALAPPIGSRVTQPLRGSFGSKRFDIKLCVRQRNPVQRLVIGIFVIFAPVTADGIFLPVLLSGQQNVSSGELPMVDFPTIVPGDSILSHRQTVRLIVRPSGSSGCAFCFGAVTCLGFGLAVDISLGASAFGTGRGGVFSCFPQRLLAAFWAFLLRSRAERWALARRSGGGPSLSNSSATAQAAS
jgi:hypothetical protein